ncbi:MAG: hypothetical protein RR623_01620 [Bacilli bacterium]
MPLFNTKEPTVAIVVTDMERRIIITALTQLRDNQIRENKEYEFIETIIGKSALAEKSRGKNYYEER